VKTKADLPLSAFGVNNIYSQASPQLAPLLAAYFELDQLKQLYRQGWLLRGVPPERCESVADHVFGMAMLAWWITDGFFSAGSGQGAAGDASAPPNSVKGTACGTTSTAVPDRDKVIRMVLVHELGEIYTGDLVPGDHVPAEEKHRREREGLWRVVGKLPKGQEYLALWDEYEAGETPEARFVRQVDRLEMAFQARVYQQQGFAPMGEFYESAEAAMADPALKEILAEIRGLR
jgi:putative hydrolase of HD superfamily